MASHLNLSERRIIVAMLQRKISVAQIAIQVPRTNLPYYGVMGSFRGLNFELW